MTRPLQEIITEASSVPTANTTVTNLEHFIVLRAPLNPFYRNRINEVLAGKADLLVAQKQNFEDGLMTVHPVFGGFPKARWYLRNQSSLGVSFPVADPPVRHDTMAGALEEAVLWWDKDSWNRQVIVPVAELRREITSPRKIEDDVPVPGADRPAPLVHSQLH